ncbi:MAG: DUF1761 domain-containing protein [Chitinophagales bacterium]|nr:DUF1761 domain-containing protein [Chitinophagales bacterium]
MGNAIQHLNILAVLLAAVAYFALGALWYSPILFGKQWAALNNINMTDRSSLMRSMVVSFACMLLMALVTGIMMALSRCKHYTDCLEVGILLGAGYAGGILGTTYTYQKKPLPLWFIDIGFHFCGIVLASAIIAAM